MENEPDFTNFVQPHPECKAIHGTHEFWDGSDAAGIDWWRGYDYGSESIIRELKKWIEDKENKTFTGKLGSAELDTIRHKIYNLKLVEQLWNEQCTKLQNFCQKYNLGIAGEETVDIVLEDLEGRIHGF
jgi:hypothetical protein